MKIRTAGVVAFVLVGGCATIVNDANMPLTFSFSDGSSGKCIFRNKRGAWETAIPTPVGGVLIRRSDDALRYDCTTSDGRTATGSIKSEIEKGKMAASVVIWDLGITDSITDKHRHYQPNNVIQIAPAQPNPSATGTTGVAPASTPGAAGSDAKPVQAPDAK